MVHLTCALKAVEEHAQRIVLIHSTQQEPRRRVDTVHLSDVTAPTAAAVAPAASPLFHDGLKSAAAGEALMSAAMSRPQDMWNVPNGATFEGVAATYSPAHHETVV